jgi:sugar phosphate isomerase/epimerase
MHRRPEVVAAYWTIAGTFPGVEPEYSPFDFKDRVEAAAMAGFTGMGLWHADLEHVLRRRTLKEMKKILDANGIRFVEVEFLTDWFLEGEKKKESDVRKRKLMAAAEVLHAKQIKVGDFYQRECSLQQATDAFGSLCAEAEEHGTRIAFEPMAVSMVRTLKDSLAMIEGSGMSNGGIVLDLWHVNNLDISYEEISRVPAKCLFGAEINDGVFLAGKPRELSVHRRFCGEGEFDIDGFVRAVEKTGYAGPWGVEIFSEELLDKPLEELTTLAFNTSAPALAS